MDKETAKLHLAGYRPEIYTANDPSIADALALVERDPELAQWLEEEIAFDRRMIALLGEIEPPADAIPQTLLKAQKAGEIGEHPSNAEARHLARTKEKTKKKKPAQQKWLAAAAVILLLGVGAVKYFLFPPPVEFVETGQPSIQSFRDQMAYFANARFVLDKSFRDISDSQRWLEKEGFPVFSSTPGQIVGFRGMGCKAIDWQGTKVSLVCFQDDEKQIIHLFIVDASELTNPPSSGIALEDLATVRGLQTAGWETPNHILLLVGSEPDVSIANLL